MAEALIVCYVIEIFFFSCHSCLLGYEYLAIKLYLLLDDRPLPC